MITVMMKQAEEAESTFGENETWKSTLQKFLDQFKGGFPENHKQLENPWLIRKTVDASAAISKMRNSILHDDMDRLVTGADLVQARFFTMIVPVHLISNSCGKVSDGLQGYAWDWEISTCLG